MTPIPAYDDLDVIAGQATIALEILRQARADLSAVLVPVGGGGLAAGIAAVIKSARPEIRVIGVEPEDSDAMAQSLRAGRRIILDRVGIFADGVAVRQVGVHSFELCRQYLDDCITVGVDEICAAIKDVFEDTRCVLEPAGALGVAGLKRLAEEETLPAGSVVAIASGANINFDRLAFAAERAALGEHREAMLAVTIPERPGSFLEFCRVIGERNVVEFTYRLSSREQAHIFVGVEVRNREERQEIARALEERGYRCSDLTGNEMAKLHVRYMVGGRAPLSHNELLYSFQFPELRGSAGGRGGGWDTPWSGFDPMGLAVGSLTLAGLPPTAGFVSEWFLLESLMQQFRVPGLGYRLVLALAGAAVALTVGFAGVTFVRLVGLCCLGGTIPPDPPAPGGTHPPGPPSGRTHPPRPPLGWAGRAAIVVLAVCCLAIAAVTPLEIRVIAAGLSPAVPASVIMGALKSPWILQPVFAGFSILSPSWLWVEMPLMLLLVGLLSWAVSGRRLLRVRRVPAWRSATIGVEGADSYTAFGYANPTRRVLAGVLHTRSELRQVMMEEDGSDDGSGAPDRADVSPDAAAHLRYASDVVEVVETYLYRPALGFFMAAVTVAKRLQSGRLDAYLLYMLIALVAVIAVVTALA